MWSLTIVLLLVALGLTVGSAGGKVPLWAAVFLLVVCELLQVWPP